MKILFIHQNFPGQFLRLAPALQARGHQVLALTDARNTRPSPVRVMRYQTPDLTHTARNLGRTYSESAERGWMVARACRALRDRHGYQPDVILGHSGWGETLFLREIWPDAKLLIYAELMYRTRGHDVGFDPEINSDNEEARVTALARSAHLLQALVQADGALTPTRYQADSFPADLRHKITVVHDGVDTQLAQPDCGAVLDLPDGLRLQAGDEVLTYVARSLEPYRGFHRFMRALPAVLAARPKAQVVIVGGDGVSYGAAPKGGGTWKARLLAELEGRLDLSRIHFLGHLPHAQYLKLLQISKVHCYLTYPFVLSWSLIEAMAAGCYIVGSDTAPVREVIEDGKNGRLVGFFDQDWLERALISGLEGDPAAEQLRASARQTAMDRYDCTTITLPKLVDWVESFAPQPLVQTVSR